MVATTNLNCFGWVYSHNRFIGKKRLIISCDKRAGFYWLVKTIKEIRQTEEQLSVQWAWKGQRTKMYTFKQVAELAGLHENTARTYRDRFLEFFSCTGEGRRRRYPEEAVAILKLISEKVSRNLTQEQIQVELERKYGLFINTTTPKHNITTPEDDNNTETQLEITPSTRTQFLELVRIAVAQELRSRDAVIAELKAEMEESIKNFDALMAKQEKHDQEQEEKAQDRDIRIVAQIRDLMEKQKKSWWQFWK